MQINRLIIFLLFVLLPIGIWANNDVNASLKTIDNKSNLILQGQAEPNQIIKIKIHNTTNVSDVYYAFVMSDKNGNYQLTQGDIDLSRLQDGELLFDISTNEEELSVPLSRITQNLDKGLSLTIESKNPYEYKSDNMINGYEVRTYSIKGQTESNIKVLNIEIKDNEHNSIRYAIDDINISNTGQFVIENIDLSNLVDGDVLFLATGIDEAGNKTQITQKVLKDTNVAKPILLKRIKNNNLSNVLNKKILVASGRSEPNAHVFFKFSQDGVVVEESVMANENGDWEILGGDLDVSVFKNRSVYVEIYQIDVALNRSNIFQYKNEKFKRPIFPITPIAIDAQKYQLIYTITGNTDEIKDLQVTQSEIYVATYGGIKVYGKSYAKLKREVEIYGDTWVNSLVVTKDKVFAALSNGNINVYTKGLRLLKIIKVDSLAVLKLKKYGEKLLCSSASGLIKIFNMKDYTHLHTFKQHQWDVGAIYIDGNTLYSGSDDYSIKVWDLSKATLQRTIKSAHAGTINDIVVYKDKLISASEDKTIVIRELKTGKLLKRLSKHKKPVNKLMITNDFLISVSSDRKMILWDMDTGEVLKKIKTHSKRVGALAVNDFNIVTGSRDYKIKIWGYDDSVEALDSEDETAKEKYALIKSLKVKRGMPTSLSQNENDLIVSSDNGYIDFYNKTTHDYHKQYNTLAKIQKPLKRKRKTQVMVMDDEGNLVSEDDEPYEQTQEQIQELRPKLQKIYDCENFGNKLLCSLEDTSIKVWDMEKDKAVSLLRGDTSAVKDIKLSSLHLLTASKKGTVGVYDIETSDFVNLIEGHQYDVNTIALYEEDKVVSAGDDYSIKVRDIESGDLLLDIKEAHSNIITKLMVYENFLISASMDHTIKVRDIRDGKLIAVLVGHLAGVTSLALDEDDWVLLSSSDDKTLKAWSLKDFSLISSMDRHKKGVVDMIITDDYIVSIAKDKTIKVWKYYE